MLKTVSDVQLRLPASWFQLPVQPFDRDRNVHRLVRERIGHRADAAPLRRHLERLLRGQLREAWAEGAVLCAALVEPQPESTPPALFGSIVVVVRKAAPTLTPDAIARGWGASGDERISLFAAGDLDAVKIVDKTTMREEGWERALDALTFHYFVRAGDSLVIVAGHTINVELEAAFESLFDAIVSSLELS